jgi:hypothetical protein
MNLSSAMFVGKASAGCVATPLVGIRLRQKKPCSAASVDGLSVQDADGAAAPSNRKSNRNEENTHRFLYPPTLQTSCKGGSKACPNSYF